MERSEENEPKVKEDEDDEEEEDECSKRGPRSLGRPPPGLKLRTVRSACCITRSTAQGGYLRNRRKKKRKTKTGREAWEEEDSAAVSSELDRI